MSKTNWEKMVNGKDLNSAKSARRKQFDTLKIKSDNLLQYVDEGWEKSKEYKNPKFVGITKEKDAQERFENRIWMLFASMGFSTMNADREFYMSYDFHNDPKENKRWSCKYFVCEKDVLRKASLVNTLLQTKEELVAKEPLEDKQIQFLQKCINAPNINVH